MQEVHVVGVAIIEGSKVLAAQRSNSMNEPLKWEFAGGKVEPGETHEEALKREVYEELGVKVEVKGYVATGIVERVEKRIFLHVYEAVLVEGFPTVREHAQLRWMNISELNQLDWAEADIPACNKLMQTYG